MRRKRKKKRKQLFISNLKYRMLEKSKKLRHLSRCRKAYFISKSQFL